MRTFSHCHVTLLRKALSIELQAVLQDPCRNLHELTGKIVLPILGKGFTEWLSQRHGVKSNNLTAMNSQHCGGNCDAMVRHVAA